ncbi:hypothetical protein EHS25_002866 [Saitozyma podzolica]|uniref:Uncharacterized protein n=1 Tax=Saitozyma podzolica TaxID=1890683 RepID=A0A427YBV7_9TREE|nr:hypothetical protein EHS25_002866 [Saitozyma podzolica]
MPPRLGGLRHVQANNGHRAARLPVYDFLLPWAANLEGLGGFWSSNPRTRTRGTATAASYVPSPRDDDPADEGWTASYRPPETESHLTTLESSPFGLERGGGTEPANAAAGPSRSRPAPSLPLKTTSHRDIRKVETESPPPTLMPSSPRRKTRGDPDPADTAAGSSPPSFGPPLPPSLSQSLLPRRHIYPRRSIAHALKPLPTDTPLPRLTALPKSPKPPNPSGTEQSPPPQPTHISRSLRTTLSRPNPPDPRHLLTQLRHEPSRLSRDDGELLMSYSRRMSDARTERWTKDLMGRMRLAPVEWVKVVWGKPAFRAAGRSVRPGEPIVQRSTASQGPAPNSPVPPSHPVPEAIHAAEPAFPADMEEAGPSVTPPKRRRPRLLSLGLNTWAVRSWPPNSNLTLPCTSQQFLQYTHYRLALSDAPRPQLAEMLDALGSFLPAHEPQDALDVLHLFLAYPSRPARAPSWSSSISPPGQSGHHDPPQNSEAFSLSLLNEFVARYPAISPTRQTLHLIITSCLGSGSHRTRTRSPSDVNESVSQTSAGGLLTRRTPWLSSATSLRGGTSPRDWRLYGTSSGMPCGRILSIWRNTPGTPGRTNAHGYRVCVTARRPREVEPQPRVRVRVIFRVRIRV